MTMTSVTGSYPKIQDGRRARLRTALARLDKGEISPRELARVEDDVTREVLREQADAGIELATDGHVRWFDEVTYIAGRLSGVDLAGLTRFFDTNTYFRRPTVDGAIEWTAPITVNDYTFAAENSAVAVKPVLTGPYTLARLSDDRHYGGFESLLMAYATALNLEARALQAKRPPLIQFNEPAITKHPEDVDLAKTAWLQLLDGIEVETAVSFYFGRPDMAILPAIDAGFTTIGVDATIDGVLGSLATGPRPRKLAAGVVDARTTRLEPKELIRARIEAAEAIVGSDKLYVNPNMGLEYLPRTEARAKLTRLVQVARDLDGVRA